MQLATHGSLSPRRSIAAIDLRGLSDPWVADCLGDVGLL